MRAGFEYFERSAAGASVSSFHLEAAIAACHCAATTFAQTDWPRILSLYDNLLRLDPSPITARNRTVALAQVQGSGGRAPGFAQHRSERRTGALPSLSRHLGATAPEQRQPRAEACFRRALELATVPAERELLSRRIEALRPS